MICHVPSMGSCRQFCLILHPHRVASPFPATFASPGEIALFKFMAEQLCWRQNLGPPLKYGPQTTKFGVWGHLMAQINPSLENHHFPMNMELHTHARKYAYTHARTHARTHTRPHAPTHCVREAARRLAPRDCYSAISPNFAGKVVFHIKGTVY